MAYHKSWLGEFGKDLPSDKNGWVPESFDNWETFEKDSGEILKFDWNGKSWDKKSWTLHLENVSEETEKAYTALDEEWKQK